MVQRVREVLRLRAALCDFPRNQYASLKNAARTQRPRFSSTSF